MDLATIQSGTFRGQTKLSKYGNARLRRTLWMAGQVAILNRPDFTGGCFVQRQATLSSVFRFA
jgi:hypothetical protein